jgi:hypothetical protein
VIVAIAGIGAVLVLAGWTFVIHNLYRARQDWEREDDK